MEKRVELLAPCGSYESFLAAVNAGADAVYLGGREFGARAYAENFSEEELISAIRQAHLFGVKVYLTVNTLVKEQEFSRIYDYILPLYEAGLDGVIVQDMGVLVFLKARFPDLKFHASTQMTITGIYGAAYLKKAGCERIVPARELSLEEISSVKEKVPVEIEAFIHGAMCYCYSGQCLMSSVIGGRSGNRGKCAQPCRLPYKTAGKEGYFLSLKDMNTLEHLPELIEAGIDSFKIEGRMKKPEYVAGVVSVYRKYIDKYYEKGAVKRGAYFDRKENILETEVKGDKKAECGSGFEVDPRDKRILSDLYIRSETGSGYYFKSRGREMLTLQKPGYNEADPALLKDLRDTYIRELPKKALHIQVQCRAGEPLFMEGRLSDVMGKAELCVSVSGPAAEWAKKRAVSREEIRGQLIRTGGTPFAVAECSIVLGENTFVPMKWIKQLRRELLQRIYETCGGRNTALRSGEEIRQEVIRQEAGCLSKDSPTEENRRCRKEEKEGCDLVITVQERKQFEAAVSVMEKAEAAKKREIRDIRQPGSIRKTLVVDADLLMEDTGIRERLYTGEFKWGIKCPVILRRNDEAFLERLQAVIEEGKPDVIYCGTIDVLAWVKSISYQGRIAGEASLYAWNQEAVSFWEKELDSVSIPLELDSNEIRKLCTAVQKAGAEKKNGSLYPEGREGRMSGAACPGSLEAPVYGRAPFMVTANCIRLSSEKCGKDRKHYTGLTDRMGNIFPVYTNCAHCYNIIYNCLPTSYHENLWMLLQDGIRAFRIEFTTEDEDSVREVVKTFHDILASELQEKNRERKTEKKDKGNRAGAGAAGREKRKNKGAGKDKPETERGKIAGMAATQGRFHRPVE